MPYAIFQESGLSHTDSNERRNRGINRTHLESYTAWSNCPFSHKPTHQCS